MRVTDDGERTRVAAAVRKVEAGAQRVMRWFPVRVWSHFAERNGLVLAAGVSYQALFAVFAALYLALAVVGIWLGGSTEAIEGVIDFVDQYLPGFISTDDSGVIERSDVIAATRESAGLLGVTGAIALAVVVWTATGWVTFTRAAVRDILGLPREARNFAILKFRDLIGSIAFALLLLVGFALSSVATWALGPLFRVLEIPTDSVWFSVAIRLVTLSVTFIVDAVALVALFRFLIEADLRDARHVWPASLAAGAAVAVLQAGAGLLIGATPANPLLATFAVLIGLLLWFRIVMMVILIAAAWIAVGADDDDIPLIEKSPEQVEFDRQSALLLAARVRLRRAQRARADSAWYRAFTTARELRAAEANLADVQEAFDEAKRALEVRPIPFSRRRVDTDQRT